jgi:predicted DNA-binding transcriptional regulator AlpA
MVMLSKKEVVARTGLSAVTIWRRVNAGDFPQPRQLTPNRIGWPEPEIEEWEASRPVGQCELPANFKGGRA